RAMKTGLGSASARRGALVVGALAVVNAWGDVIEPETGRIVAGLRDSGRGSRRIGMAAALRNGALPPELSPGRHPMTRVTRLQGDPDAVRPRRGPSVLLELSQVPAVVAGDLLQGVSPEFLQDRLGQDEGHHRLAHHTGSRDGRDVGPFDLRLELFLRFQIDAVQRLRQG